MKNPLLELGQLKNTGSKQSQPSPEEKNVRYADAIFRSLADKSSDLLVYLQLSPKFRLEYINPACISITGYNPGEFHADSRLLFKIIHPDDKELFKCFVLSRTPSTDRESLVVRCSRANGTIAWLESSKSTICDDKGKALSILVMARDITARITAEEALRESQRFSSSLLEHNPLGIMVINPDTSIRYVNPAWEELNGWTLDEVIGMKAPYPWWPEEGKERLNALFNKALTMSSGSGGSVAVKKNGEKYDLFANWVGIRENSVIKYTLMNTRDVTERNRMEKALKDSEEIFSAAFRSSPDLMVLIDTANSRYVEVNDSFLHATGYTREELLNPAGKQVTLWANPDDNEKMVELLKPTGNFRQVEFQFKIKSGEIRTWLCSADIITVSGRPCMLCVATDITERKSAEQALRESEERFFKAFNSNPGSVSISRLQDNTFIEVNESFLRDQGYTRNEVIGRTLTDLGFWADTAERDRILGQISRTGSVRNEIISYHTKTGELKTGYCSAVTINIGNEPCLIMHTIDVTPLKKAEQKLRLLSSITEQVSDSTIITDSEFKITYLNHAACEQLGYSLEEVLGKDLAIFCEYPNADNSMESIRAALGAGKVYNGVAQKRRKDGSLLFAQERIAPLQDEHGSIVSYIHIQHDITDLKETESRLQANKDLVESILASMPEGVLVVGTEDRVVLANDAFFNIFSIRHGLLSNKPLSEILHLDQLKSVYDEVKNGKHTVKTIEFRYQKKDIKKIIACVITRMPDGRTLLTFSDVSQDREEEAKLYLTDRLASIGEMAAGLAHELNNPLTGILALSQMLLEGDLSESDREDASCIYEEAKRAATIVKNVLLFTRNSRSDCGRSDANGVIKDVLRLREYETRINDITVVVDLENNLPDAAIDQYQFQQVFLNLILNAEAAIKEVQRPGILTVTSRSNRDEVSIKVTDNGCGIKKNVLPRIFDPFFTTKDIGKGTGLGLSICYGITVKHGGHLGVDTRVNEGTTFTVTLPVFTQKDVQGDQ